MADASSFKKYFAPTNLGAPIKIIAVGVVLFLIGAAAPVMFAVGLVVIGIGAFMIYNKVGGMVTDAEVQAAINANGARARAAGLSKLGLDPAQANLIEPVVLPGPDFSNSGGRAKRGKDGRVRTAANKVLVLFFSEHLVHCYTYRFDVTDPSVQKHETDEYFYKDVVSVATATEEERLNVKGKSETVNFDAFLLRNAGGETLKIAAYDTDDLNSAINGMRALIKQKKMA